MSSEPSSRSALRLKLLAARDASTPSRRHAWDARIREHLLLLIATRYGAPATLSIGAFHPLGSEPDLRDLFDRFAEVALPKVVGRDNPLQFLRYSAGAPLVAQRFGVMVPVHEIIAAPTLLIVPCVGFHADAGRIDRLGYGGGYYDRTLALHSFDTIGVAYDMCRVEAFRPEVHDQPLDFMVTESGVVPSSGRR